jgi:RNA polymerase sigma factor (sigma-70 family)
MNKNPLKNTILNYLSAERKTLVAYVRRMIHDVAERDGEDIIQDVALSIFDRADITIPIENAAAYVYQAIRNKVVDYMRKGRKTISLDDRWMDDSQTPLLATLSDPKSDGELAEWEAHGNLKDLLGVLNEEERGVLIATELNGETFQELAKRSGIPLGTLLARKSRALQKVRSAISITEKGGKNGNTNKSGR